MTQDNDGYGAPAPAVTDEVGVARGLTRIGLAATVVFAAVTAAVGLALEVRDARYGGWQVLAVAIGFGGLAAAVGGFVGRELVRAYRRLVGRTPHRRAVVLAALLPGVVLGMVTAIPSGPAISWASDHTGAAAADRALARKLFADYRAAPPVPRLGQASAPADLAVALLDPATMGSGWHSASSPNPTDAAGSAARQGGSRGAKSFLARDHWTGSAWSSDGLVLETVIEFGDAAAAKGRLDAFARDNRARSEPCSSGVGPTSAVTFCEPASASATSSRWAAFVDGQRFFELLGSHGQASGPLPRAEFERIAESAVRRAAGA